MNATSMARRIRRGIGLRWEKRHYLLMRILGRSRVVRAAAPVVKRALGAGHETSGDDLLFPDLNVDAFTQRLRSDGFAPGIALPENFIRQLTAYADGTPCYANRRVDFAFMHQEHAVARERLGESIHVGYYSNIEEDLPDVATLSQNSTLLDIASRYLNAPPTHIGTHMWWSFVEEHSDESLDRYAQLFHYDLDDYAFLKFFFYLTDVDEDSGPHVFVLGSHTGRPLRHRLGLRRLSDEEVEEEYGAERVHVICGEAGSGFAEDTYGLHKGIRPHHKPRLLFQIEFGLWDYGLQHSRRDLGQPSSGDMDG